MKTSTSLFLIFSLISCASYAQVGIGTTNPNAQIDIRSSDQTSPANTDGVIIPKIDEFPIANPTILQDGMMVYATGAGLPTNGFYYWDNTLDAWQSVTGARTINDLTDGKSDNDGSQNGSSVFFGIGAGANDNQNNNRNVGIGYQALMNNTFAIRNTAYGYQALFNNTGGQYNIANGYQALYNNTTGVGNVAIGGLALFNNTTGNSNIANGIGALLSNTAGNNNIANGDSALFLNTTGDDNIANGYQALLNNTTGYNNIANGFQALLNNITGYNNIAIGYQALSSNTTGIRNIANGHEALRDNTTGGSNIANGYRALRINTTGFSNIALGTSALASNTTGGRNIAIGSSTLLNNSIGDFNIANGYEALRDNTLGDSNIGTGVGALRNNTIGSRNVALGSSALSGNISGSYNIAIGNRAGITETGSNTLYIESSNLNTDANSALIYGEFDSNILRLNGILQLSRSSFSTNLLIANTGSSNLGLDGDIVPYFGSTQGYDLGNNDVSQHWDDVVADDFINFSDRRLKNSIREIPYGLETILALNPVTYRFNEDYSVDNRFRLGLIAQEVEAVIPEVVFNEDIDANPETGEKIVTASDYKSMSYVELVPVLIKAIQEQHQIIEAQQAKLNRIDFIEEELKSMKQLLQKN